MKLATFDWPAGRHVGIVEDDEIVDLTATDPSLLTMVDLLERGPEQAAVSLTSAPRLPRSTVKLGRPVPRARNSTPSAATTPHTSQRPTRASEPAALVQQAADLHVASNDPIWIPTIAPDEVDCEGELGDVIGRRGKNVPNDKAAVLDLIAGFTVIDDVSVGGWQELEPAMVVSKSFDTHGPHRPLDRRPPTRWETRST